VERSSKQGHDFTALRVIAVMEPTARTRKKIPNVEGGFREALVHAAKVLIADRNWLVEFSVVTGPSMLTAAKHILVRR